VLLAHSLGRDRGWLYAHSEYLLSPSQLSDYQALVARRANREPVAYLAGHKEFFGLDFIVTPDVLIPRPETEQLVEMALQVVRAGLVPIPRAGINHAPMAIADVGTGSGAIAVTLAVHLPEAHVFATDTSPAALAVARRNAARHGVADRVHCVQGDLLAPLKTSPPAPLSAAERGKRRPFQLIVANPPYLSQADLAAAPPEVARWEPRAALDGGPDGLAIIRRLLAMVTDRLCPAGALLVEIGAGQGADVLALARRYLAGATVEIARDYAGLDRVLVARFSQ
jgi:release factor glutamine methyltransferase